MGTDYSGCSKLRLRDKYKEKIISYFCNDIIVKFSNPEFRSYIVGGFLRDLFCGLKSNDIDIVVNISPGDIYDIIKPYNRTLNSFGGFKVNSQGVAFDIWSLERTKGIKELTGDGLASAMDFNVNAVAADLSNEEYKIYCNDMFLYSLADKEVEINNIDNVIPERGIKIANKLGFSIGPELVKLLCTQLK